MTKNSARAVVIGSGIAGLSAAMALAGAFDCVTIVERDDDLVAAEPRPGVPQGRQPHLLLCGGLAALRRLFPRIDDDLVAAGAIPYSAGSDLRSEIPGLGAFPKRDFDLASLAMPRPVLEQVLLRRLLDERSVRLSTRTRAVAVETSADGSRVTGLAVRSGSDAWVEPADVVVDASGQAAVTLGCLRMAGREPPRETAVEVDIGYSCAIVALPSAAFDLVGMITHAAPPTSSRAGYMVRIADDRWQVLLVGRGEDQPPATRDEFLAFAKTLATPTIADALRMAEAPEAFARFRFRASVRRAFGGASAPPAGLFPIGDALCRLNPIYGQGMTVAAQQASALRDLVAGPGASLTGSTQDFLAACEPLIERAWAFSVVPDFAYPETVGDPPADIGARLDAQFRLFARAMEDAETHRALLVSLHLAGTAEAQPERRALVGAA